VIGADDIASRIVALVLHKAWLNARLLTSLQAVASVQQYVALQHKLKFWMIDKALIFQLY
jgi:hypothetical protein